MIKIKICGLTREEDIIAVNRYNPDYIGFVFAESKRKVSSRQAENLKSLLNKNIKATGVFVNENPEKIISLYKNGIIDVVQLHGDEDGEYIQYIKSSITAEIIKAVNIKEKPDIQYINSIKADYLLFDSFSEGERGGSGKVFDHSLIPKGITKPYFLAGGLNIENIAEIKKKVTPFAFDVSSGVEENGVKSEFLIEEFIKRGRN